MTTSDPLNPVKQARFEWRLVAALNCGQRIYRDGISGSHAIADQSGGLPQNTEDGVRWIATDLGATITADGHWVDVVLRVSGPRVGPIEAGKFTRVFLSDLPVLKALGFAVHVDESAKEQVRHWRRALACLDLEG